MNPPPLEKLLINFLDAGLADYLLDIIDETSDVGEVVDGDANCSIARNCGGPFYEDWPPDAAYAADFGSLGSTEYDGVYLYYSATLFLAALRMVAETHPGGAPIVARLI